MRFFWDTQYYMDAQQLIFPSKLQTDRYSFHNVTTTSSIPFKHKEEHRFYSTIHSQWTSWAMENLTLIHLW